MKRILVAALMAGLAAVVPASLSAQPHPEGGHPGGGGGGHPGPAMHAPAPAMRGPTTHATMGRPSSHGFAHRPTTHSRHTTTHHAVRHVTTHRHVTVRAAHHARPTAHARSHLSAKVAGLRRNVRATRRFHAGAYRGPAGYHYQRWTFGQFLPGAYWARDFWITDFLAFGLFAPPDGYIWVRYGPDAMLIDQYTGEIIQVDYGVFY